MNTNLLSDIKYDETTVVLTDQITVGNFLRLQTKHRLLVHTVELLYLDVISRNA